MKKLNGARVLGTNAPAAALRVGQGVLVVPQTIEESVMGDS